MVENKHSVNTVLSFGAKSVNPDILEKLLVGRSGAADHLFKTVTAIVEHENNQQILVIGQRGMGKTHLIRILYHRCQNFINQNKLVVAYFAEEEYGVSNYFDFLIRIIDAFIRWDDQQRAFLHSKIEQLQNTRASEQIALAETIIDEYRGNRPLLILAENFGDILNGMGVEEQGRLRAWLYNRKRINIIATNQSISDDFDREDRPFYGFFNPYYLKPLSFAESLDYLVSLAQLEERDDIVKHLRNKGKSQVRAIHQLVKGNHRLLVTFYQFLKSDTLAKLSNHFIKTINDLKPYYETYIRYLPPQQQKILRFVALSRGPQLGTVIQKNCFIDQNSLSKQLSELVRKRLLESILNPKDKRNRLYDINEPLLRISIEVGEHKEGITALFIDFLALYYDEAELRSKMSKFSDLMKECRSVEEQREFNYEIIAIQRAIDKKIVGFEKKIKSVVRSILKAMKSGDYDTVERLVEEYKGELNDPSFDFLLAAVMVRKERYLDAIKILENQPESALVRHKAYRLWGILLSHQAVSTDDIALIEESLEKFGKSDLDTARDRGAYYALGNALVHFGIKENNTDQIQQGIQNLKLAAALEEDDKDNDVFYRLQYATELSRWSVKTSDSIHLKEANELFEQIARIDSLNKYIYIHWGGALMFASVVFPASEVRYSLFINEFKKVTAQKRLECWERFAGVGLIYLLNELVDLFIADCQELPEQMTPIAIGWITNLLKAGDAILDVADLALLRKVAGIVKMQHEEMKIIETFIDTYELVCFNDDKGALYKLPKEQRELFENEILNSDGGLLHYNSFEKVQKLFS